MLYLLFGRHFYRLLGRFVRDRRAHSLAFVGLETVVYSLFFALVLPFVLSQIGARPAYTGPAVALTLGFALSLALFDWLLARPATGVESLRATLSTAERLRVLADRIDEANRNGDAPTARALEKELYLAYKSAPITKSNLESVLHLQTEAIPTGALALLVVFILAFGVALLLTLFIGAV